MLTAWILSLMIALQPKAPWKDSYEATAAAIDRAVGEQPPLFDGPDGRAKTAALLVSLAWAESSFKPNAVGKGGVRGLYQIGGKGHGDLTDPVHASRTALELVRQSFRLCKARPLAERLAFYAGGSCKHASNASLRKSRFRVMKALALVKKMPPSPSPSDEK